MANGTLANLAHSAFVCTPRSLAQRALHHLLCWPQECTVLDPTAGEGDLLFPTLSLPGVRQYGIEISAERANVARAELGKTAQIVTAAFEAVSIPRGSMSVVLAHPPYFFANGKRAEYVIISRVGEALVPGGILLAIIPARSAWDGIMINHWVRWYDQIRVWKFPDRRAPDDEGAFEDFTQICVVGIRRAEPVEVDPAERQRLQGYRWRVAASKGGGASGWEHGTPPPELPTARIADPYHVPSCRARPELVVRHADEALLLEALAHSGAHRSSEWEHATCWPEEETLDLPSMPLTGPAHLAAAILNDAVGGRVITGPDEGPDAQQCLFTAFIGSQWVKLPMRREEREKLHERHVIRVEARQWQDQPVLGVMDLDTGHWCYYEGQAALTFLEPWLKRLAEQVMRQRPPLYQLQPAAWELRLLTQFATDKRLPNAAFPGLAPAQMHRICAMGLSLDVTGRTAIQGEPGTGKTRLGTGSAARQAYRWRYRDHDFARDRQPAWVKRLRRAWLKNPRTLAMLGLEPVYGERLPATSQGAPQIREDPTSHQLVAYREIQTGTLVLPEDAGPRALPVLVTTPKKVTKEYGKEIHAAWPQAEVIDIDSYQDIPRFMQRCAQSTAPAVIGIFSHSATRAFGCTWEPAVQERVQLAWVPDLDPPDRAVLEAVCDRQGLVHGYRVPGTDRLITKELRLTHYRCPDCLREISVVPGSQHAKDDPTAHLAGQFKSEAAKDHKKREDKEDKEKEPVTSRVYFEKKQRWCRCQDRRNQERVKQGLKPRSTALWQQRWRADLREKYPPLTFAEWQRAMEGLRIQARQQEERATLHERAALIIADRDLQTRLTDAILADGQVLVRVAAIMHLETSACVSSEEVRQVFLELVQHSPILQETLIQETAHLLDWQPIFFRAALQRWQTEARVTEGRKQSTSSVRLPAVRLQTISGAIKAGRVEQRYQFQPAIPSSCSPYDFLYREFRGCVALAIVDESHNGRGTSTDIAHAHHLAMLSAQTRELTSGTHYGGDILSFYHYWFRFHPGFWKDLGLGWHDAAKALKLFGVIQEWTTEYESEARKWSGQTDVRVSTIPAPGLSSKLIPRLLTDLNYLTVLDVGAYMPPRIEIPELVNMSDPAVRTAYAEAEAVTRRVRAEQVALQEERQRLLHCLEQDEAARPALVALAAHAAEVEARHTTELAWAEARNTWGRERDLEGTYHEIVQKLEQMSQERNQTARMGKGTIPRWFAALPCDAPFTLEQIRRGTWGEELGKTLLLTTPRLCWDYLYPAEVRLREIVLKEVGEKRRVMVYIEQNELRSMSKRLAWVFQDLPTWTLPKNVKSEDRQQAILDAVHTKGITLLFVPYRKVNEGLNLQTAIDTIVWYELAMNLFLLDQASRRAWRLGKQEEVRIYYLAYAGTSGHSKLRKLGNQSGAAAAFAGEPARGALIEHVGADQTTLARLAASVDAQQVLEEEDEEDLFSLRYSEEEAQQLKDAFARRAAEEREVLQRGRQWLGGVVDTLPKRLPAFFAETSRPSVWAVQPTPRIVLTPATGEVVIQASPVQAAPPVETPPTVAPAPPSVVTVVSAPREQPDALVQEQRASQPQAKQPTPVRQTPPPSVSRQRTTSLPKRQKGPTAKATKETAREQQQALVPHTLIFGNAAHIALARRRKPAGTRARITRPKGTSPVDVRTIAAMDTLPDQEKRPQVVPLSLWDVAEDGEETEHLTQRASTQPTRKEVRKQQRLW